MYMDNLRTSTVKSLISLAEKNAVTAHCYRNNISVSSLIRDLLLEHLDNDDD